MRVARFCETSNPLAVCMPPICDLRPVRPVTAAGSKRHERTTSAQHLHDAHRARAPVLRRTARGPADLWPRRRTACDFIVAMRTITRSGQLVAALARLPPPARRSRRAALVGIAAGCTLDAGHVVAAQGRVRAAMRVEGSGPNQFEPSPRQKVSVFRPMVQSIFKR